MENLKKPSIFKRLGAMVFDILVWFLLSLFLLLVAIDPLVNVVTKYNDKKYEYNMGLFDAYAVVYVEYKEENNDFSYELVYDASSKKEEIEIMKDELLNGSKNKRYLVSIVTSKLNIDVDYYLTNFYEKIDNLDVYLEAKTNE